MPAAATTYVIGLGSNLGSRQANIAEAVRRLAHVLGPPVSLSPCIESEPWGYASPNRYANAAATFAAAMPPPHMLELTQAIERDMGRTRKTTAGRYEDRIIDIDILAAGRHVVYDEQLRLPHPRMWQRPFVQQTLAALRPTATPLADYAPRVATIGFFDGLHRGHRHLLAQLATLAQRGSQPAMVLTFDRHPHDVVRPTEPPLPLLTTHSQKEALIAATATPGAAAPETWTLHFTPAMAALTARQFMDEVLRCQLNVGTLLIGYDHRFGHPADGRREGFADYVAYGRELGISVVAATELPDASHVSSSAIRRAIAQARFDSAAAMLGRPYALQATVVHGHALGRRLGFPTANLQPLHPQLLIPPVGVYAAWALTPDGRRHAAMVNIGHRPTIDNGPTTIEAHLIGYDGDLYDTTMELAFVERLRSERRFDSEADLARQLRHDRQQTTDILAACDNRPGRSS